MGCAGKGNIANRVRPVLGRLVGSRGIAAALAALGTMAFLPCASMAAGRSGGPGDASASVEGSGSGAGPGSMPSAAARESARSMVMEGDFLMDGRGVQQDAPRAVGLYESAFLLGEPLGARRAALAYLKGAPGVARSQEKGMAWLEKAALSGDVESQMLLGSAYGMNLLKLAVPQSEDVPLDEGKAFRWFSMAANAGDAGGAYQLGDMYLTGRGTRQDVRLGLKWLRMAEERGSREASRRIQEAEQILRTTGKSGASGGGAKVVNGVEFVWIPGTERRPANMGDGGTAGDRSGASRAEDRDGADGFFMARTPVTLAQYRLCVAQKGCAPLPKDTRAIRTWSSHDPQCNHPKNAFKAVLDHPMNCVTLESARKFCRWLGGTLPTVRQWERAARHDGTSERGVRYPWGDRAPEQCRQANYGWVDRGFSTAPMEYYCDGGKVTGRARGTSPVGAYSPEGDTPLGLVDMAGNVWEWTEPGGAPSIPAGEAVLKGGSWKSDGEKWLEIGASMPAEPGFSSEQIGFRCVLPLPSADGG